MISKPASLDLAVPRCAASIAVAAFCLIALTTLMVWPRASSASELKTLQKQGYARLAISNEPPWTAMSSDGKASGAGPDLARAILQRLGVKHVKASVTDYGAMIPGLQANRFDIVDAGLLMKPQRCRAVAYSEPDLCDAEALAVKKGNPLHIVSYADVAKSNSAKIGVCGGCVEERYALKAGVPRDRAVVVPDEQSGLKMLEDGRIDAYALPALSIRALLKKAKDPNLEEIVPVKNTPVSCAGAAFRKQDVALRDAYDKVLAKMKADGEFAKIIEPYGFSAKLAMSTTRAKLCSAGH